jgi:RimJ/RimL family protein N-acetyltransferase
MSAGDDVTVPFRPLYPIATERLRLRPLTLDDMEGLIAYRGRPDVCRYLPFEPMDEQVLSARLSDDLGRTEIRNEGDALTLGVELADSGQLVGDVVLFFRSAKHLGGELGYVFRPDVAGHGYATEACVAVLNFAFDAGVGLGLHRVIAQMDGRNLESARLAERLGMRREACFRRSQWFKGEWADLVVYALLAEEWNPQVNAR